MTRRVGNVLTIGGSDSSGCSGIQADVRAVSALGGHALVTVTAVTAQKTDRVEHIWEVPPETIEKQLLAALDTGVGAVKTGMLPSPSVVELVASALSGRDLPIVVDPVIKSSSGHRLVKRGVPAAMRQVLFPLASLVTPNLAEAALFSGVSIDHQGKSAARALVRRGASAVLITGGHAPDPEFSVDLFFDGQAFVKLRGRRIQPPSSRGSGCTLAAAIATCRAGGSGLLEACREAKQLVEAGFESSYPVNSSGGALGVVRGRRGSGRERES